MDDLWSSIPSPSAPAAPSSAPTTDLVGASPQALIAADINNEQIIISLAPQVVQVVMWCDQLCESVWELANYTPPNLDASSDRSHLWKGIIIPKLVQALVDDTKARNCLQQSISAIRTLGVAINENAALIRQTNGSAQSIKIAREHIKKRMDGIISVTEQLKTCQSAALDLFKNHSTEIMQIIGPNAAKFAAQEAELQDTIDAENQRIAEKVSTRAAAKSEVEKLHNLSHVVSTMINGVEVALNETKARSQQFHQLNMESENKINSIPTQIDGPTTTTVTNNRSGWWFWRRTWSVTTTSTSKIANPNRETEVNYYTGIINARMARLKEANKNIDSENERKKALQTEEAELKGKMAGAQEKLQNINKTVAEDIGRSEDKIKECVSKIQKIREEANNTENLIGMRGSVLLQCLSAIRSFAKAEKNSTLLWQPMISVLEFIAASAESSVSLLDGDRADVFVAGLRLLKNVGFYDSTAAYLLSETSHSEELKKALEAKNRNLITN